MGKDSSEIKKQMKDEKMATFPRKLVTKEGGRERERKKKTVSKGRYRVEGFSCCNVFATKELFACVLDVGEAYACLEGSEKDTVIFPL